MRVSVMLDTNVGAIGRPSPTRGELTGYHSWFLECARLLDDTAVSGVFVAERHGRTDCYSPAPLEQLAALAAVTSTLRVGTYVLMPPLYPPLALLERLAVVDHLSGGRLVCGFGVGFHPTYFTVHEAARSERGRRMDTFLELLDRAWSGRRITVDDEEIYVLPPAQEPRPPVWIGGTSSPSVHRAARFGEAFAIGFTDRRVEHLIDEYRDACREQNREPSMVSIQSAWIRTGIDVEGEAVELFDGTLGPEMTMYQDHGQLRAAGEIDVERMMPYMYVGDPDTVVERVRRDVQRWDLDEIILRVHIGVAPRPAVQDCLELIADQIAPALVT